MKLRNEHIITAFFVFSVVFFTSNARAELIEIAITATVNYVEDEMNRLEGRIHVDDLITGTYTYESTTLDSNPDPGVGDYWHYSPPPGVLLTVGGFEFKTDSTNVELNMFTRDNIPEDRYGFYSYNNLPLSNGTQVKSIYWFLVDDTATALSNDALPTTAPILGQWQTNELSLEGDRTFLI